MRKDDIVVILEDAKFMFTQDEIDLFIQLWNGGYSAAIIADRLHIAKYNVALLVMHCDLEKLIQPRPGGFAGTIKKKHKPLGRPKMVISL